MPLKKFASACSVALGEAAKKSAFDAGLAQDAAATAYVYPLPVLPASPIVPTDGRDPLVYDAQQLIDTFRTAGRKLPVDLNHDTEYGGGASGGIAVGWILDLFVAEDGTLYAWTDLNDEGIACIEGKRFGYTSPTVLVGAGGRIAKLKSLALTNNPALEMPAVFSAQDSVVEDDETEEAPASTAEIAPETTEQAQAPAAAEASAEITQEAATSAEPEAAAFAATAAAEILTATDAAAVSTLDAETQAFAASARGIEAQVVAAGFAFDGAAIVSAFQAAATVQTYQQQVQSLTRQLADAQTAAEASQQAFAASEAAFAAYKQAQLAAKVSAAIDGAIAAFKFTPAMREQLEEYGQHNLQGLLALIDKTPANTALFAVATHNNNAEVFGLTPAQLEDCKRTGIKPETYAATLRNLSNT